MGTEPVFDLRAMAGKAINGSFVLSMIPLLLPARFALTMISYGSGSAGGIFAPILVIGTLGGLLFGMSSEVLLPSMLAHPQTFALLGMGALFTSVVRAPLTGIILMVEMTGQYEFMLPLLVSCLTAYGVAEAFRSPAIYEALRHRRPAASR
ncbi:MAG: chloride channel protein [Luteolibacter sp.]